MKTKREIEKMEYEAPVANVYELMSEGCILSASDPGANIEDIGTGGELGTRTSTFNSMPSERPF